MTAIFNSSLEVAITAFGETPSEGSVFHCADACVTVVVVGDDGGPSAIPFELDPQTRNQRLRFKARARALARFSLDGEAGPLKEGLPTLARPAAVTCDDCKA